jgi:enoyl-CoA hydratase/carnithine racemase
MGDDRLDLQRDADLFVLTMNNGPNVIDPDFVDAFHAALDTVEAEGPCGLIITGQGKFFCNGLNVPAVMSLEGEARARFGVGMARIAGRYIASMSSKVSWSRAAATSRDTLAAVIASP